MKKKAHITIISNNEKLTYEVESIVNDNAIIYMEDDSKKTKVKFDYNKNELIRENKELFMQYNFEKNKMTIGKLVVQGIENGVSLRIMTKDILRYNDNVQIKFTVENEPMEYIIEVIE